MPNFKLMTDTELRAMGRTTPALRAAIVTELKRRESLKLAAIASRLS